MEVLKAGSSSKKNVQHSDELIELIQRIIRIKNRLKVVIPENIRELREKIKSFETGGKSEDGSSFELFYRIGNVFARNPGPLSMGELSRDLEMPLSTATRIVDWLVNNGYAMRLSDPKDRRIVRVALTDSGVEIYRIIQEVLVERLKGFMRRFTVEERDTFLALLRKVVDALEQGI